ncbi:MAG: enoyl-CoA hydratase/isomerase family protein [Sphingobium sp.]
MTDRETAATQENIAVDRPAPHVLRVLINRPAKLNAVDFNVREEMYHALKEGLADPSIRALVLGGVGGNLSAGGDVPSMIGLSEAEAQARLRHIHRLCRLVAEAPVAVVTAAEGWAAGASVGLSMLGDYIIVGPSTKILVPFFKLGLIPDWGMMRTLPQRVGIGRARRIIFESQTIKGEEAVQIGLADILADDAAVMDTALAKAAELARMPRGALALVKQRWATPPASFEEDLAREEADQVQLLRGEDFKEGFAAFTEKRGADFTSVQ